MHLSRPYGANRIKSHSVSEALFARFFSVEVSASLAFSETSVFHCRHRPFPVAGNRPSYAGKIFYCLSTLAEPFLPVTGLRERANASRARFFRARYTLPLLRCGRATLSCRGPSERTQHARFSRARNSFRLHRCDRIAFACRGPSQANTLHSRLFRARSNPPPAPLRLNRFFSVADPRERTHHALVSFVREVPSAYTAAAAFLLSCRRPSHTDERTARVSFAQDYTLHLRPRCFCPVASLRARTHRARFPRARNIPRRPRSSRRAPRRSKRAFTAGMGGARKRKNEDGPGAEHMRPTPSRKRCFRPQ